eukprot:2393684-Rhodomonas_salina.1
MPTRISTSSTQATATWPSTSDSGDNDAHDSTWITACSHSPDLSVFSRLAIGFPHGGGRDAGHRRAYLRGAPRPPRLRRHAPGSMLHLPALPLPLVRCAGAIEMVVFVVSAVVGQGSEKEGLRGRGTLQVRKGRHGTDVTRSTALRVAGNCRRQSTRMSTAIAGTCVTPGRPGSLQRFNARATSLPCASFPASFSVQQRHQQPSSALPSPTPTDGETYTQGEKEGTMSCRGQEDPCTGWSEGAVEPHYRTERGCTQTTIGYGGDGPRRVGWDGGVHWARIQEGQLMRLVPG